MPSRSDAPRGGQPDGSATDCTELHGTSAAEWRDRVHDLVARYGAMAGGGPELGAALATPLEPVVWAHPLRIGPDELRDVLLAEGCPATPVPWYPGALRLPRDARPGRLWPYRVGLYHVQEEASLLPVHLLGPEPGHRVLDLCAAPGGKTAQIALALRGQGTVVANDRKPGRMAPLQASAARLGFVNVTSTVADGPVFPERDGPFDRVLVDVPCSAEGTVRKAKPARAVSAEFRRWVVGVQRALLRRAVELCRPGGRIVYSTCTFAPEENEAIVDAVLREHPGELRVVPCPVPGLATSPGLRRWDGAELDPRLVHAHRLWPHRSGTGGFFAVLLERTAGPDRPRPPVRPRAGLAEVPEVAAYAAYHGLDGDVLAGLAAETEGRYVRAMPPDHDPPRGAKHVSTGLPVLRNQLSRPKLTTAAAIAFGSHAQRQVVDLDRTQAGAYWARRPVWPEPSQSHAPRDGFVIVRFEGRAIGVADQRGAGTDRPVLISQFPKNWAGQRQGPHLDGRSQAGPAPDGEG